MEEPKQSAQTVQSSFFVLNVWEEEEGGGHMEWRGEILDVDKGAVSSFDDWPEAVDLIAAALHKLRPSGGAISPVQQEGRAHNRIWEVSNHGRICE